MNGYAKGTRVQTNSTCPVLRKFPGRSGTVTSHYSDGALTTVKWDGNKGVGTSIATAFLKLSDENNVPIG